MTIAELEVIEVNEDEDLDEGHAVCDICHPFPPEPGVYTALCGWPVTVMPGDEFDEAIPPDACPLCLAVAVCPVCGTVTW